MSNVIEIYEQIESSYLDIIKKYVAVDEHNFQDAMAKHPSTFAFFAGVMAYAKKELEKANVVLDDREAELREERRAELLSKGQKATDRALDAYVRCVPELQVMRKGIVSKSHRFNLCKNIVSSLDHQKDVIIQLSANRRAEAKLIDNLG